MTAKEVLSVMESILFASGDPVPLDRFCRTLELDRAAVEAFAAQLCDEYTAREGGVRVVRLENSLQMITDRKNADYVRAALEIRKKPSLSATALEVLAIIAYKQPVTRQYVEQIRGVDSSYTIGSLNEKGLIYESGRLDVPGRPILYCTTEDFLRCFGLSSISDLPEMQGFADEGQQLSIEDAADAAVLEEADGADAPTGSLPEQEA